MQEINNVVADLFYISFIMVFIIDVSGFVQEVKRFLASKRIIQNAYVSLKPFDCSLCATWWCGILYLLFSFNFSLFGLFILSVMAAYTSAMAAIMLFAVDLAKICIDKFYDRIRTLNKDCND